METVTLSLPESLKAFVEEQAEKEGFDSVNEYLVSFLREIQRRQTRRELDSKLLEGLHSAGADIPITDEYWDERIRRYEERHPERNQQ